MEVEINFENIKSKGKSIPINMAFITETSAYFVSNQCLFGAYPTQHQIQQLEEWGVDIVVNLTKNDEKKIRPYRTRAKVIQFSIPDRKVPEGLLRFEDIVLGKPSIVENTTSMVITFQLNTDKMYDNKLTIKKVASMLNYKCDYTNDTISIKINRKNLSKRRDEYIDTIHSTLVVNNVREFCALVIHLTREIRKGKKIYIHCKGGHGRAGLLVAAILCYLHKITPKESFIRTSEYHATRPVHSTKPKKNEFWKTKGSPQTQEQREFVRSLFQPYKISKDSPFTERGKWLSRTYDTFLMNTNLGPIEGANGEELEEYRDSLIEDMVFF